MSFGKDPKLSDFARHDSKDGFDLTISKLTVPSVRPQSSPAKASYHLKITDDLLKVQPHVRLKPELQDPSKNGMISVKSVLRTTTGLSAAEEENTKLKDPEILTEKEIEDRNNLSLHQGIIQNIQTLRRYKFGVMPRDKTALFKQSLTGKPAKRYISPRQKKFQNTLDENVAIINNSPAQHRTRTNSHDGSIMNDSIMEEENNRIRRDDKKKIVIRKAPVNLDLYQLTSLPPMQEEGKQQHHHQQAVTTTTTPNSQTISPREEYSVSQVSLSAPPPPRPSTAPTGVKIDSRLKERMPPLYSAASFRVPSKELVSTFGGVPAEVKIVPDALLVRDTNACGTNNTNTNVNTSTNTNTSNRRDTSVSMSAKSSRKTIKPSEMVAMHKAEVIPQKDHSLTPFFQDDEESLASAENVSVDGDCYQDDRKEVFLQDSIRSTNIDHSSSNNDQQQQQQQQQLTQQQQQPQTSIARPYTSDGTYTQGVTTYGTAAIKSSRGVLNANQRNRPGDALQSTISAEGMVITNGVSSPSLTQVSAADITVHRTKRAASGKETAAQFSGVEHALRCTECYKVAHLWCKECVRAYCVNCWGKIEHHSSVEMATRQPRSLVHNFEKPPKTAPADISIPGAPSVRSSSLSPPGSPKMYNKSVLFNGFDTSNGGGNDGGGYTHRRPNTASQAPVTVPRPDSVVTEYRDYPLPPVYLDGRGNVYHTSDNYLNDNNGDGGFNESMRNRPQTSPTRQLRCRSPLNREPQDQSRKYNNGSLMSSNSNLARLSAKRRERAINLESEAIANMSQMNLNNIHYMNNKQFAMQNPLVAASGGQINNPLANLDFVRSTNKPIAIFDEDDDYRDYSAPIAFSAGGPGGVTVAYSSRPSTESRPMTGITRDFTPADWQFDDFTNIKSDLDKTGGGVMRGVMRGVSSAGATGGLSKTTTLKAMNMTKPATAAAAAVSPPPRRGYAPFDALNNNNNSSHNNSTTALHEKAKQLLSKEPDLNERVLEIYRGVAVYTKNNLQIEAKTQASQKALEASVKAQRLNKNKPSSAPALTSNGLKGGGGSGGVLSDAGSNNTRRNKLAFSALSEQDKEIEMKKERKLKLKQQASKARLKLYNFQDKKPSSYHHESSGILLDSPPGREKKTLL